MPARVRPASEDDVTLIYQFITELAEYEKLSREVTATAADLHKAIFGANPVAEALIAEIEGRPVGYALFFRNFSTFLGKPGLYLEDLYVQRDSRGRGAGKA